MLKSLLAGAALALVVVGAAEAQSTPGLYNGQVPTAQQWNSFFGAKEDFNVNIPFTNQVNTWLAQQNFVGLATFYHAGPAGSAPTISSCGTSPAITGGDQAGTVTTGTGSPTACTITFATSYAAAPNCVVVDQSAIANLTSYSVSATAITLATAAASSQKIAYVCSGS